MPEYPPDFPRRIVRPRKPSVESRPIIAIGGDLVVVESLGEDVFHAEELPEVLKSLPSSIIAVSGFGQHLERLQLAYQDDPQFDYRITPVNQTPGQWRNGIRPEQGMVTNAICNYVGWKAQGKRSRLNPNRYHYPIDPIWFLAATIDDIDDSNRPQIVKLYEWAKQVREWCQEQQLTVKPTAGGLAAQLLRDSRFYPNDRRKCPKFINAIARTQLPGNYYRLHGQTKRYYKKATCLDMENAHHALARRINFPDVNSLRAYGHWGTDHVATDPENDNPPPRPKSFAPPDSSLLSCHGLFHVRLSVPHIPREWYPPPYMESAGERDVYLYSNELELVKRLGGRIIHIYSAYVSAKKDTGLNAYAEFAIQQIRKHKHWKRWLKPTLHASYGLLAARPSAFETGFYRSRKGHRRTIYHMGNKSFPVATHERTRLVEANIANVIHRGMIEAEVRKEALYTARELHEDGHNVLSIYADSIFIEDKPGHELRLLMAPWRVKETVTSLRFHSATTFTSPQMTRMPGIPRDARQAYLVALEQGRERQRIRKNPPINPPDWPERAIIWHAQSRANQTGRSHHHGSDKAGRSGDRDSGLRRDRT